MRPDCLLFSCGGTWHVARYARARRGTNAFDQAQRRRRRAVAGSRTYPESRCASTRRGSRAPRGRGREVGSARVGGQEQKDVFLRWRPCDVPRAGRRAFQRSSLAGATCPASLFSTGSASAAPVPCPGFSPSPRLGLAVWRPLEGSVSGALRVTNTSSSPYASHRPHRRHVTAEYDTASAGKPIGAAASSAVRGRGRRRPTGVDGGAAPLKSSGTALRRCPIARAHP
jgi:hypothetical protein